MIRNDQVAAQDGFRGNPGAKMASEAPPLAVKQSNRDGSFLRMLRPSSGGDDTQGEPENYGVFGALEALKQPKPQPEDDERRKYSNNCFGRIAGSKAFEYVTISVIILNALTIGWDAEYTARFGKDDNLYKGPLQFIILECLFCAYFTVEISIRFIAYRAKWRCILDAWFVFDSVLVTMMITETWVLPFLSGGQNLTQLGVLRLLRLLRITRMAKLMRALPQLMMIVKGIVAATKAVFWTGFLLMMVTYTWAILFTNEYHQGRNSDLTVREWAEADDLDDPTKYGMDFFGSMGKSMLSLLVMGTILDDVTACCDAIRKSKNTWMLFAFILYILLNSFTMMNMLVGILVEVVGNTAEGEKNRLLEEGVKESIMTIFGAMDSDNSGCISREEFLKMKRDPKVMSALKELDVKDKQFDMYVELLFQPDDTGHCQHLSFRTLLDCICRLRPGTSVNSLDFASFRQSVLKSQNVLRTRVVQIERMCSALANSGAMPQLQGAPVAGSPQKRASASMLADLDRASTEDIVGELQRRLGMASVEENGVPWLDDDMQGATRPSEVFHTLGVPMPDQDWSKEVLTC